MAADMAHALMTGRHTAATLGTFPGVKGTVPNGAGDIPSVLLAPVVVTKENVKDTVIRDGFWTVAQVCTGDVARACEAQGLR
jgi:D-xylose transport system substrate-binding protein